MPPGVLRRAASAYAERFLPVRLQALSVVGESAPTVPAPRKGSSGADAGGTTQGGAALPRRRVAVSGWVALRDGRAGGGRAGTPAAVRAVRTQALRSSSTAGRLQGFPPQVFFSVCVANVRARSKTSRFKLSWTFHQIFNTSFIQMRKR